MPTPGYVFRDGGTTPTNELSESTALQPRTGAVPVNANPQKTVVAQSPIAQATSESHALATENHELEGAAQMAGKEARITNLGWQANAVGVSTLVGGIPNEELWTLVRRFNKVQLIVPPASRGTSIHNCLANVSCQSHS